MGLSSDLRPPTSELYSWYVVAVLMLANVSSFVDRQVMSQLLGPIKRDLALTDVQVSWLLGFALAAFYAVMGLPIGRLADSRNRRAIIGWGIAAWSVMCALCGIARNYWQLFLARVGVGVGEASLMPPAFSLIADYFPPKRLASAMSVFGVGTFFGSGVAYIVGGTVIQYFERVGDVELPIVGSVRSWQLVFIAIGAPGILVALLALTIREPRRTASRANRPSAYPLRTTFSYMRNHLGAFSGQGLGFAVFSLVNYGTAAWFPAFFGRVHGWNAGQVGAYMGGATVVFGTIGILAGGRVADWLKRRGSSDANLLVGIVASVLAMAAAIPLYLTSSFGVLIAALIVTNVAAAFPWGAAFAAVQEMTPAPMRGQASAVFLFLINVLGALGPTVVALLTDDVFHDEALVGRSLLVVTVIGRALSAAILFFGLPAFRRAIVAAAAT